jgi:hypothetical protein
MMVTSTAFSRVQIGGVVFVCWCGRHGELQRDMKSRNILVDMRQARVLVSSCLSSDGRPPHAFTHGFAQRRRIDSSLTV